MKKVVVLYNKISENPTIDELDVLDQVKVVAESLVKLGYDVEQVAFSFDLNETIAYLKKISPDFIFNLVESIENDGQLICVAPALLDFLKIPYTGCTKEATFLTSNKVITKKIMVSYGILTPEWVTLNDEEDNVFIEGEKYILKAVWEDASICLENDSVVSPKSKKHLIEMIQAQNDKYKKEFFAERYIHGRDFSTPLLAGRLLPSREMLFLKSQEDEIKVFGYKAKWEEETDEYENTEITFDFAKEDEQLLQKLQQISLKCWKKFNLNGYARVDFRTDNSKTPYVLEINPNPCIAPETLFHEALILANIDYTEAIKAIIEDINHIYTLK